MFTYYSVYLHPISQEKGYQSEIRDVTLKKVRDTITAISVDNPAFCALGGFKEGSTAVHGCRQCMVTPEDMQTRV